MKTHDIQLGFETGTGAAVAIPLRHMAVTGQTQQSGKTTTLEALAGRTRGTVLTFITKRGEGSFVDGRRTQPYFRDRADWQFVTSIIDATLQEKNKFLRPWIMKICRATRTLAEVQQRVKDALLTAKGINEGVYTQLDAYLELIVPEIERADMDGALSLHPGVNVMDVSEFGTPMQMLFVQSALDWINERCRNTTVVIPEAWEFIPQGKGSPVKASAIALVRKGAALGNHIWVDSQDMAGVDKEILRGCTVWLVGVQREANEIKRNLQNIPAGIKKPRPDDIASLERGQFFACFEKTVAKVYVQPSWMDADAAYAVAVGDVASSHFSPPVPRQAPKRQPNTKEPQVNEQEAQRLRDTNAAQARKIVELENIIAGMKAGGAAPPLPTTGSGATPPPAIASNLDIDALYVEIRRRAQSDPGLLRILTSKPEIEVEVQRKTLEIDGSSLKGRLARLIVDGFFDSGATQSATRSELKRLGPDVNSGNLHRAMNDFHHDGFFTLESGNLYQAVPEMKININRSR